MKDHDPFEPLIARTLRDQPLLRAPESLERRVLAQIERRAALPWWQRNFVRWPRLAQAGFVLASAAAAKGAMDASVWAVDRVRGMQVPGAIAEPVSALHTATTTVSSVSEAVSAVFHGIPAYWIYAVALGAVALYSALIGLGAVAYRTLYK